MEDHRPRDVACLVEVGALRERGHAVRVGVGLHDRLEDEVDLECARVVVGHRIGGERFEDPDVDAVGPL